MGIVLDGGVDFLDEPLGQLVVALEWGGVVAEKVDAEVLEVLAGKGNVFYYVFLFFTLCAA